jgi:hypothetical protein
MPCPKVAFAGGFVRTTSKTGSDCEKTRENISSWPRVCNGLYFHMMRATLSIYLAATIFACPLLCNWGVYSAASQGAEAVRCPCCAHAAEMPSSSHENPSSQDGPSPRSGGSCQCICGGAVVDEAESNVAELDTSCWLPVAIMLPSVIDFSQSPFDRFCAAPWPDDGVNVGRALCCLYSTLLC